MDLRARIVRWTANRSECKCCPVRLVIVADVQAAPSISTDRAANAPTYLHQVWAAPSPVDRAMPPNSTKTTPPASEVQTATKTAPQRSTRATAKPTASATPAPTSASTTPPTAQQRSARATAKPTASAHPTPASASNTPPDDEPWIKLEVKPSPDNSTLVKQVTRSAAPVQPDPIKSSAPTPSAPSQPTRQSAAPQSEPARVDRSTAQPTQSTPPPALPIAATNPPPAPQPQRVTVERSPVPPPARPQPQPGQEVIEFSSPPPPPPLLTQIPTTPLIAAAKPLETPIQTPATPQSENLITSDDTHPNRLATTEAPELDRLIADLESDLK